MQEPQSWKFTLQSDVTTLRTGFSTAHSVLCQCNKAQHTVNHVEMYLFDDHDQWRVLPGHMCDIQMRAAISHHAF